MALIGRRPVLLAAVATLALAACGGGGTDTPAPAAPAGPTDSSAAQRSAAATSTATSALNACAPITPFYWEIGDREARRASGSVTRAGSSTVYTANSLLQIASASKWLYGAYVVQKRNAVLSARDIDALRFRSGYTNFSFCLPGQSIDGCLDFRTNGAYTASTDGLFAYDGGHMQHHASQAMGLGPLLNAGLASEIRAQLGSDIALAYTQPQLAGGAESTADDYARFLRKLLDHQLLMGELLGKHAVCTHPATCGTALRTPVPATESWHYALAHWVEDDPRVGDGAFSSAGGLGFYPWIDADKRWYGVLARQVAQEGEGFNSTACGRLIRKAWTTGVAQ